jgi:transposase
MARKGQLAIRELCQTFGVSRQTLYRAMAATDRASAQALELKPRGRKPKPANEVRTTELEAGNAELSKQLEHWKTKYQVVRTLLDLERKLERGEPLPGEEGKKRRLRKKGKTPTGGRSRG